KQVMLAGASGHATPGNASEPALVVGDDERQAPPISPHCWSLIAMHPNALAALAATPRAPGQSVLTAPPGPHNPRPEVASIPIPATRLAEEAGNLMGAGMIMLGAFVAHSRVVSVESVVGAMRAALPSHRARMADANAALLQRGADFIRGAAGNST